MHPTAGLTGSTTWVGMLRSLRRAEVGGGGMMGVLGLLVTVGLWGAHRARRHGHRTEDPGADQEDGQQATHHAKSL
jgi:hypothetical protein